MKLKLIVFLAAVSFGSLALAQNNTNEQVKLTDQEMQSGLSMVQPPEMQERIRESAISANNFLIDLSIRRVIAEQAKQRGMDQDGDLLARLRLVEDKLLFEAFIAQVEAQEIKEDKLLRLAQEQYRVFPERYRTPEEVRVRHILIKGCECAPESGREKAESILARLKAGEPFADLAIAESADSGTAYKGGDLGFFARGKMVKPFEEAAFALKEPGDLSALVETQFGYHIILLEERKQPVPKPFLEVKEELIEQIRKELQAKIREDIIRPVRERLDTDVLMKQFREAVGGSF